MDVEQTVGYLKASWVHRNFLGGLRRLTISERPGLTAYPTRIDYLKRPTRGLFQNDLSVELRQPSFIEARTAGWTRARYSVYPLLYPLPDGLPAEDWPIIGYHDVGTAVGLERAFWDNHIVAGLAYHWNANVPRSYQPPVSELDNVYVSFPELSLALDLRDDPVTPTRGIYLHNSLQVANPLLVGTVSDLRFQSGLRTFYPLSSDGEVVLATRVKVGFVFPQNYGQTFDKNADESRTLYRQPESRAVTEDQQKILFRAFYSGGPNSNRGYAYRQVGSQGPIGFLLPTLRDEDCALSDEDTEPLPAECLRPLGGFSLWEASMEIRFPLAGDFFGTIFVDASDVSQEVAFVAFDSPHISIGPGLRYRTPIGPLRLDIGYRVPGLQVRGSEGQQTPSYFPDIAQLSEFRRRAPFAYHIAIGEAF
jgi:outer membrane protein insertion porin family/translocation and assembly module TamA